jgi:hypothetical protein
VELLCHIEMAILIHHIFWRLRDLHNWQCIRDYLQNLFLVWWLFILNLLLKFSCQMYILVILLHVWGKGELHLLNFRGVEILWLYKVLVFKLTQFFFKFIDSFLSTYSSSTCLLSPNFFTSTYQKIVSLLQFFLFRIISFN